VLNQKIRAYWDKGLRPVGRSIGRLGINPNLVTIAGVLVQAWAGWLIVRDELLLAGLVTIGSSILDVLDGAIAKARGMTSKFGALLDSTTDRLSDALAFLPIAWLYGVSPAPGRDESWIAVLAMTTMVLSFLVSYVKARAESLGFDCGVGLIERAERMIIVIIGLVFDIVPIALAVLAAASLVTFIQRIVHVRAQATSG
jgi:CDP-diacylglycerol--glycerol-3-phosphate 3-phosphatidyltransferase